MAIPPSATILYRELFKGIAPGGRLMMFGRQKLLWDDAPSPEDFFKAYGFAEVHSLDVSPYEGATHIHDLNDPHVPDDLRGAYRVVMSGGTLEHVFTITNAIKIAVDLLEVGGTFAFSTPCNNWIDHGFYQLSPTLKFDFAKENQLELGSSRATFQFRNGLRRSVPLYPGEGQILNYIPARVSHGLTVRKTEASTIHGIPKQGLYLDKHDSTRRNFRFRASEPFDVSDNQIVLHPMNRFSLTPAVIRPLHGGWAATFRNKETPASLPNRPFRSKALVYEDGKLLNWIVSDPVMVAEQPGSFCHFPGFIHFSTGDGSDPRENGKSYEVRFPVFPIDSPTPARADPPANPADVAG